MKQGRPYPPDREQRVRVMIELAKRDMTINDLARALGISQQQASCVINGIRRSPGTEEKIAAYFGMARKDLFKWGDRVRKTYPPDRGRRVRVKLELVRRDMTVSDLARALGVERRIVSVVISGTRRTRDVEDRIAAHFGMVWEDLFKEAT
jgi:plasmid maintenance system antidote protein VapI